MCMHCAARRNGYAVLTWHTRIYANFLASSKRMDNCSGSPNLSCPSPILLPPCAGTKLGDQSPALLFENIKGYKTAKIAMNVHASWPNHALAIGMAKDTPLKDQFFEFVKRYQTYPGKIERRTDAPWKEVVVDKDINLYD